MFLAAVSSLASVSYLSPSLRTGMQRALHLRDTSQTRRNLVVNVRRPDTHHVEKQETADQRVSDEAELCTAQSPAVTDSSLEDKQALFGQLRLFGW